MQAVHRGIDSHCSTDFITESKRRRRRRRSTSSHTGPTVYSISTVSCGGVNDDSLSSSFSRQASFFLHYCCPSIFIVDCLHAFLPLMLHRATNNQTLLSKFVIPLLSVGAPQSTHCRKCRPHRRAPRAFSTPTLACVIAVSTRTTPLLC